MVLFDLDERFAKDVLKRGGAAFADWFADDGVVLNNGAAPLIGKVAIVKSAAWMPNDYQLTWTPADAMMGPSGDMGYTWGHFEGHSKDASGNPVTTSGRYMTVWRKEPGGNWKVVLDAGANEPPESGECCKLPGH
jgi:ketosteroid isomerase-like protein